MIFNLTNRLKILKQFNGEYNYFNPSCIGDLKIFRREHKYKDILLVSDIVDDDDNIILQHHESEEHLISYEDARLISENDLSVCECKRKLNDLTRIPIVSVITYNLDSKKITRFKTQNAHFEKHWQFYCGKILYHINPYTVMSTYETIIIQKYLNWDRWRSMYGEPRLSTNIFNVNGKNYLLFHSSVYTGLLQYKYYIGLLYLDSSYCPIGYYVHPFFEATREYSDNTLLNSLWEWRHTELHHVVKYEVIFPMNVEVDNEINIYAGINDCSAAQINISIEDFICKIKNEPIILL